MSDFGKVLVLAGITLLVLGLLWMVVARMSLPIGRLPGDFIYRGKNTTFYFPLTTSILLSVLFSLVLYVIRRLGR
jgi:hypothetical protein